MFKMFFDYGARVTTRKSWILKARSRIFGFTDNNVSLITLASIDTGDGLSLKGIATTEEKE